MSSNYSTYTFPTSSTNAWTTPGKSSMRISQLSLSHPSNVLNAAPPSSSQTRCNSLHASQATCTCEVVQHLWLYHRAWHAVHLVCPIAVTLSVHRLYVLRHFSRPTVGAFMQLPKGRARTVRVGAGATQAATQS
eukprot:6939266-Prymnesium_polylepis.1